MPQSKGPTLTGDQERLLMLASSPHLPLEILCTVDLLVCVIQGLRSLRTHQISTTLVLFSPPLFQLSVPNLRLSALLWTWPIGQDKNEQDLNLFLRFMGGTLSPPPDPCQGN